MAKKEAEKELTAAEKEALTFTADPSVDGLKLLQQQHQELQAGLQQVTYMIDACQRAFVQALGASPAHAKQLERLQAAGGGVNYADHFAEAVRTAVLAREGL